MKGFTREPLDQTLANCWNAIYPEYRKALIFVLGINLLAFGFEMSNLTLHHDDVAQIFIQDTVLGYFVGRFGLGWLNYYGQNAYFVPFLQMSVGILFMSAYGLLIARFWGVRQTTDIVLVASVLSVFPYMAQIYQYNTAMATYTLAHFLVACAIFFSTKATLYHIVASALLYSVAFSIYQSVIVNAATIFIVWTLGSYLYDSDKQPFFLKRMLKSALTAIISVGCGGLIYLASVSFMEIRIDDPGKAAAEAFSIKDGFNIAYAATEIIKGTRSFYFWPEAYFPEYLKKLQLIFLACAVILCVWLPKNIAGKICAVGILIAASLAPRLLQLLHPQGNYHTLTLTAYAVVIAGALMIINRAGYTLLRNVSIILAFFLIAGYILQCSWISTVNHLNTLAHYNTLTQIMSRIRSIPDAEWDGTTIAVVGVYDMPSEYPFRKATGVAVDYIDAQHMQHLANLMRDSVRFVLADSKTPEILEYAATHEEWPHPTSVGVVNGMGVVILSKEKH